MSGYEHLAADDVRTCKGCDKTKPLTEFYLIKGDRRKNICRDCDNGRTRSRTAARVIRVRARHRATAELVKRHDAEFRNLLEQFTDMAGYEADLISEQDRSSHSGGLPRIRPGQRRERQTVEDRVNRLWAEVGKCRDCSHHHNHGHECENCGHPAALPEAATATNRPVEPLPEIRGTCSCPHPTRRHSEDDGCLIDGCECSGYPEVGAA